MIYEEKLGRVREIVYGSAKRGSVLISFGIRLVRVFTLPAAFFLAIAKFVARETRGRVQPSPVGFGS